MIQEYQGKKYKYDAQGNVIEAQQAGQTLKLQWDNLNRLVQSDKNGLINEYAYDVFGRRLYKYNKDHSQLTLFGWDGDLMVWESKTTRSDLQNIPNQIQYNSQNRQDYTKHYIYEPNSFVPLLQAGYRQFIQLIKTPDYSQFKTMPYSIHRDPVWNTNTGKNKVELERVTFYHCDQVGTPQTLSNEKGECVWEVELNTWGKAQQVKLQNQDQVLEQSNIRFQGQYYDEETGLHYNRYRYYEPYSARYLSKDPIGLEGGFNTSAYVNDPNQWVDRLGLDWSTAFSPGLVQYANSEMSGHTWKMQNDSNYRNKVMTPPPPPAKPPTHTPYTTLTNLNGEIKLVAGASGTVGFGHTRDEYGKKLMCGTVSVCGSAGAEASATGALGQSYTNASTSKGFSTTGSACVSGKGAAIIGASAQACQNSDGSQTYAANAVVGAGGGASGSVCYAVNYCQ